MQVKFILVPLFVAVPVEQSRLLVKRNESIRKTGVSSDKESMPYLVGLTQATSGAAKYKRFASRINLSTARKNIGARASLFLAIQIRKLTG